MRTTRTVPRRVFGASLLAGALALAAVAPAAAQVDTASAVDGMIEECLVINVGSDSTGPGAAAVTINQVWQCQGQTNDERLNGDIRIIYNIAGWSDVGAIQFGWATIENDGGSWDGVWSSNVREDGDQIILGWYEGKGAYEGWSYVETQYGDFQQPRETFGIVYPGAPPPSVVIVPPEETVAPIQD